MRGSAARRAGGMLLTVALAAGAGSGAYLAGSAYADRAGGDPTDVVAAPAAPVLPSPGPTAPSAAPTSTALPAVLSDEALAVAARATVQLTSSDGSYSGSGTVVSADGLVLTNAHVASPRALGHALRRTDPDPVDVDEPDHLVVSVPDGDGAAEPTYRASPVAVDGYLDLAVLRIDALADGSPLPAGLRLPSLQLGSVAQVEKNDRLTALGYPALTGGERLDVTEGSIRNLLPDEQERVPDDRFVVATTVDISSGNSGGAAVDNAGRLIAVPSAVLADDNAVSTGLMRPVDLARPLLEAARAGRSYVSPWFVASTGAEQVEDLGWVADQEPSCTTPGSDVADAYADEVVSRLQLDGFAPREDLLVRVSYDGVPVREQLLRWSGDPCLMTTVTAGDVGRPGLVEGELLLELFAGPALEPVLSSTLTLVPTGD